MTTMNAPSLLPLEMTRHLHRAPPGLLSPLQTGRSPPPPNFGLCTMTSVGVGGRTSPIARPRSSSTSLIGLAGDKQSGSNSAGSYLGFHGAPTAANSADNNTCRLIDYRNAQVAAFHVDGRELICLPQAFELFLKHLVGGLHTVYTKLKRLDITPVVCNVEQVRILRGLGAIQPGVNRCKLISPREFDILYEDCTNSSARPGRPPKRTSSLTSTEVAFEQLKRSKFTNFSDFYAQNRLIVDAKKALSGFSGSAGGPTGTGYMPYLDFKKSSLFSNCYNYPPQMPPHLPFIPFGYHGMMNLAVAGSQLAALQRRGDDFQRFTMSGIRPHATDRATPSQRSDEHDAVVTTDNNDVSSDAALKRHRHHHVDNYLNVDCDKPLNLEMSKPSVTSPHTPFSDHCSTPTYTAGESRGEMTSELCKEQHQQPQPTVITYEASDGARSQLSADPADDGDDDDDAARSYYSSAESESVNSAADNSVQCHDDDVQSQLPSPHQANAAAAAAAALISDQYSVETLLANVQALLKLAIDSARHREQQANIKAAVLEKQLKREKKTRRELQQRLGSMGVSNHGNGGRSLRANSPNDDGKLKVSSANDIPESTYHITGMRSVAESSSEPGLQNGLRYSTPNMFN